MASPTQPPSQPPRHTPLTRDPEAAEKLPLSPADDEVDLNDEDTDTVDNLPVATDRHPHVKQDD